MHRKIKNVVKNFTPPEVKVREATSNDPWGPSVSLMSEIAEMTYDVLMCSEIMPMIWKRINDSGKNWRHVYKAIVLLEFLIRAGHERVVRQCQDNIILIQTLRDFQHFENAQDNGTHVRESAKLLYNLLKDDERLKNERVKAANARSRFGGLGTYVAEMETISPPSSTISDRHYRPFTNDEVSRLEETFVPRRNANMSPATAVTPSYADPLQPHSSNEEDLQLQLALQLSRQDHEEEMRKRKGEDVKLQMVLEESRKMAQRDEGWRRVPEPSAIAKQQNFSLMDDLTTSIRDPWAVSDLSDNGAISNGAINNGAINNGAMSRARQPWSIGPVALSSDILDFKDYSVNEKKEHDPSGPYALNGMAPWEEVSAKFSDRLPSSNLVSDNYKVEKWLKNSPTPTNLLGDNDLLGYDCSISDDLLSIDNLHFPTTDNKAGQKMTPEKFLGANAKLVDFEELVSKPKQMDNPFAMTTSSKAAQINPFAAKAQEDKGKRIPLNQLQSSSIFDSESAFGANNNTQSAFGAINSNTQSSFVAINSNQPSYGAINSNQPPYGAINSSQPPYGAINSGQPLLMPTYNNQMAFSTNQAPMYNMPPLSAMYNAPLAKPIIQNQGYNPFL